MTARVPRLLVKSGRTVTTRVPWAAPRRRFTLSFEGKPLTSAHGVAGGSALGGLPVCPAQAAWAGTGSGLVIAA
jgi:hypothetical protein